MHLCARARTLNAPPGPGRRREGGGEGKAGLDVGAGRALGSEHAGSICVGWGGGVRTVKRALYVRVCYVCVCVSEDKVGRGS